jgi:hypothetical protein
MERVAQKMKKPARGGPLRKLFDIAITSFLEIADEIKQKVRAFCIEVVCADKRALRAWF